MTPDEKKPQPHPQDVIELKCWSVSFRAIKNGSKRFEYRKEDRPYKVGVTLYQREWNPDTLYTGDWLYHDVTFYLKGGVFGIPEGYCIVSTSEPRSTLYTSTSHAPPEQSNLIQCETCHLKGLRECIHHGYPEECIPQNCDYKIGNSHFNKAEPKGERDK